MKIMADWVRTGILNGLSDQRAVEVYDLLEGQRLYNLTVVADDGDCEMAVFKRISFSIMRRIATALPEVKGSPNQCKFWHVLTTHYSPPRQNYRVPRNLDEEHNYILKLVDELVAELKSLGPIKVGCLALQNDGRLLLNCENA